LIGKSVIYHFEKKETMQGLISEKEDLPFSLQKKGTSFSGGVGEPGEISRARKKKGSVVVGGGGGGMEYGRGGPL